MNGKSTISTNPETDFARDDAPRLTREIAGRAELAVGGKVIREAKPRGRPRKSAGERKEAVSLRLSPSVLAYFRSTGEGWQTRIDELLMSFVTSGEGRPGGRINRARLAPHSVHEARSGFQNIDETSEGRRPGRKA